MLARLRPLLVRPGARYACFGDGVCCTDLHVVGPLGQGERERVSSIRPGAVRRHRGLAIHALEVSPGGGCTFLGPSGCELHGALGPASKPGVCRRFPYGLTATPRGGRITTEHRCPCRTMGDRPPLDVDDAIASLRDTAGRLLATRRVEEVELETGRTVAFEEYEHLEASLLGRIADGERLEDVLERRHLPRLDGVTWEDVGHLLRSHVDGTACGEALAWAGDALLLLGGQPLRWTRRRPWAPSFDRAEARSATIGTADDVLGDWMADVIWSLEWSDIGSFDVARSELATRLAIARRVTALLVGEGTRADRAAAEGVLIAEMAGASPRWPSVVAALVT